MDKDISKEKGLKKGSEEGSNGGNDSTEIASNSVEQEPSSEEENESGKAAENSGGKSNGIVAGAPGTDDGSEASADPEDGAVLPAEGDSPDTSAEKPGSVDGKGTEGSAEAVVESPAEKSRMRWYVVHTYSGREARVRDTVERLLQASDLKDMFGKVLVATEEVAEMKKGKKTVSLKKLFPSYILIEMEMTSQTWSLVENVPGVTHFVGGGAKPTPIPKKEVDRILGRMEQKKGVIPEVPFSIGEHVNVIDGPFSEFTGVVDEINPERGKLKVLVSIFGRETPVELDFLQVKPI